MCLGGRGVGCCTCAGRGTRGPGRPGLADGGRGGVWGGWVSPKGEGRGVSGRGCCGRISQGLTLRRLRPRLRPRGGDRRSHYPSRPPRGRVSNPVSRFPCAPRPTSQFTVPTAPRAARCDLEAADLGRSPCRLSSPQASVPDPSDGVGRGTSPPPPAESSGGTGAVFFPLYQLGDGARAALAPRTEGPASRVPAEPPAETVTREEPLPGKARETICRQRSWQAAPSWVLRKAE